MPNQFLSPEGDLENYFVSEYWLIDQYIGDELWVWGDGSSGQLGNNSTINISTPITTSSGGTNWKQMSCGYYHTVAIKTDGTLWTWGYGDKGQLGTNSTANRSTPVTTFSGGTNWKQVSCGKYHTSAIKTDGTLWTWGYNGNTVLPEFYTGALGINNVISKSTPVTTFSGGTTWKQVSCGAHHTSAIKNDGTLWTWGLNNLLGTPTGALGTNDTVTISTPVTTFAGGINWKQVSCGGYHTSAIKTDGTLWAWGLNGYTTIGGTLGINNTITRSTPVTTFSGGTNWKQVSSGGSHTSAIKTDGTLWTWGDGSSGQLGNNSTINISTPITTFAGGTNWKQLSSGNNYTAAIKTDGTLWIWGSGGSGRLGNNSTTNVSTPVTTSVGGSNWKQVSSGGSHSAAVTTGITPDLPIS